MFLSARKNWSSNLQKIQAIHNDLKNIIHKEMIEVPDTIDNKEQLKAIWFEGGNRQNIQKIIARDNILSKRDLLELKSLIEKENKLVKSKIKRITDKVNQTNRNVLFEGLKFKKSEPEIEDMVKEIELSAEELTRKEFRTYNRLISYLITEMNKIYPAQQKGAQ